MKCKDCSYHCTEQEHYYDYFTRPVGYCGKNPSPVKRPGHFAACNQFTPETTSSKINLTLS